MITSIQNPIANEEMAIPSISGWKKNSQDGVEVDFILDQPFKIPIEVKSARKIGLNNFKSVISYLNTSELNFGIIVSNDVFKVFKKDNLTLINLPIYLAEGAVIRRLSEGY